MTAFLTVLCDLLYRRSSREMIRPDSFRINSVSLVAKSGRFYSDLRNKGSSGTYVLSASTVVVK